MTIAQLEHLYNCCMVSIHNTPAAPVSNVQLILAAYGELASALTRLMHLQIEAAIANSLTGADISKFDPTGLPPQPIGNCFTCEYHRLSCETTAGGNL
jgi:hypothetical protein